MMRLPVEPAFVEIETVLHPRHPPRQEPKPKMLHQHAQNDPHRTRHTTAFRNPHEPVNLTVSLEPCKPSTPTTTR
ncbi:hypothetical protein OK016_12850 [Vibrio chagasii]|nr:hypothetical protein [Vibrio chagasii]